MYVILYIPDNNDPEVFGPYASVANAASAVRQIATAIGTSIDVAYAGPLATVDIWIDGERNRYQLLKVGSSEQLRIHADIISEMRGDERIIVETPEPLHLAKGAGLLGG